MEKEQIIKALEWCSNVQLCCLCPVGKERGEPNSIHDCCQALMKESLALINSQEQRIKELAEEAQNYKKHHDIMDVECSRLEKRNDELTEENERLKNSITFQVVMPDDKIEEIKAECLERVELDIKIIRADTVREFAERLKDEPIKVGLPLLGLLTKNEIEDYANGIMLQMRDAIDRIAKEMSEGEK